MDDQLARSWDIAVIGMAARFPGASTVDEFWANLENGKESITFYSDAELRSRDVDPSLLDNPRYVKAKGEIEGADLFDAEFFGLTPRVAAITDPQHRISLECAWEALEDSGHCSAEFKGRIGVFFGAFMGKYVLNLYSNPELLASIGNLQTRIGNDKDFLPTLISYKLNLSGPSIAIQTACSTSLVAVHLACQSLLSGDCDMALAGGVAIQLPLGRGYLYTEGGIESPDGHCRAFDANAQGTVFGSGVGIVVLRPLKDALKDGDHVYAVIKGSAINNDGSAKVGYTAPSVEGQAAVITEAMAVAGVDPTSIGYIEAHGTATPLGDAVEIAALRKAFGAAAERKHFCAIGSVKSNIGHPDAAAGVASLIKTSLALKYGVLPPSLHFNRPHPESNLETSPFFVNAQRRDWPSKGGARRAGVSSFGIGGTNAHVILEEPPPPLPRGACRPYELLVLSAKTPSALDTAAGRLVQRLRERPNVNLQDVAFTLQTGRETLVHRRTAICASVGEAIDLLESGIGRNVNSAASDVAPSLAFMFSGLDKLAPNVGRELYEAETGFREHIEECSAFLKSRVGLDLRAALYPAAAEKAPHRPPLDGVLGSLALFVVQCALTRLWRQWGVEPEAVIGHGTGEYAAACASGAWQVEAALSWFADLYELGEQSLSTIPASTIAMQLSRVPFRTPEIAHLSSATGKWIGAEEAADPAFWAGHMRQPAASLSGLAELKKRGDFILLEIGPISALGKLARPMVQPGRVLSSLGDAEDGAELKSLIGSVGQLWQAGRRINWAGFHAYLRPQRVALPAYPFERKRYWIDAPASGAKPKVEERLTAVSPPSIGAMSEDERATFLREETLKIWAEVLGIETLTVEDDFFDLGGNSLIAMQLMAQIRDRFQIDFPLNVLFEAPTVQRFAEELARHDGQTTEGMEDIERLLAEVEGAEQKVG